MSVDFCKLNNEFEDDYGYTVDNIYVECTKNKIIMNEIIKQLQNKFPNINIDKIDLPLGHSSIYSKCFYYRINTFGSLEIIYGYSNSEINDLIRTPLQDIPEYDSKTKIIKT